MTATACHLRRRRWVAGAAAAVVAAARARTPIWAIPAAAAVGTGAAAAASTVATAVRRLVTVGSDVTEIVFALGLGARVIATDSTSQWPQAVGGLPKVGYLRSLAAEGLLSLRPDLLVAGSAAGPQLVLQQISDAGVRIVRVPEGYDLAVARRKITLLAQALSGLDDSVPAAGALLLERFDRDSAALAQQRANAPAPPLRATLLMPSSGGSPQAAGRDTAGAGIITLVGARNVFDHPGYKPVSAEALAAAAPELILLLNHGRQSAANTPGTDPLLQLTPAGRRGRIIPISDSALLAFGPRTPALGLQLARTIQQASS